MPCREINGSIASLNNSSMINSSRNYACKNLQQVKSFVDISEVHHEDDFHLIVERPKHKRKISGVGQAV